MGCIFSRNDKPNIKIHHCIPPSNEFGYLSPQGTITFSLDRKYNTPIDDIRFDGWYENSVHLWPKHTEQREHFLLFEITLSQTPRISSISLSENNKVLDTAF